MRPVSELERLSCDDPRIAERMLIAEEPTGGGDGDGPGSSSSGGGGGGGSSGGSAGDANDSSSAAFERQLIGHEGTVYGLAFSPDRQLLLSGGSDGDIRLWSLLTHSCMWVRREHRLPVWSVAIGPYGHYLASGGQDGLARLWSTDHNASLRLFSGHWSDVTVVEFHPNSNYLVTGSDDRGVRLFDARDGKCVRLLCGHKVRRRQKLLLFKKNEIRNTVHSHLDGQKLKKIFLQDIYTVYVYTALHFKVLLSKADR